MALPMDDERVVPGHRDQQRQEQFHAFTPCRDAQPASSSRIQPFCATDGVQSRLPAVGPASASQLRRARHRIVATRRPRMAAQQPAAGQPAALDRAVHLDRPERVRRTAGVVAADVAVERADHQPVEPSAGRSARTSWRPPEPCGPAGRGPAARRWRSRPAARAGAVAARGRARTTTLTGADVPPARPRRGGAAGGGRGCGSRRCPRSCRPQSRPERDRLGTGGPAWSTRVGRPIRTPPRTVRRKSSERRIRARRGKHRRRGTVRPTARSDPCADGRPGSRDRPGSASGGGNRGYGCGAEGWAGTCAWSREDSHYRQGRTDAEGVVPTRARNRRSAVGEVAG